MASFFEPPDVALSEARLPATAVRSVDADADCGPGGDRARDVEVVLSTRLLRGGALIRCSRSQRGLPRARANSHEWRPTRPTLPMALTADARAWPGAAARMAFGGRLLPWRSVVLTTMAMGAHARSPKELPRGGFAPLLERHSPAFRAATSRRRDRATLGNEASRVGAPRAGPLHLTRSGSPRSASRRHARSWTRRACSARMPARTRRLQSRRPRW